MTASWRTRLGTAGLLSAAAAALAAWLTPGTFFPVYLAVLCGILAAPLGCLAVLMTSILVRGPWSTLLRPGLERGVASLPVASLLFVPALAALGFVYPWSGGLPPGTFPFRAAWLSPGFFAFRTVLVLAVLSAVGSFLLRARSDQARRRLAVGGLVLYGLLATVAATDWMLSIEPRFHSSIFGLLVISGQLLSGLAFGILLVRDPEPEEAGGIGAILLSTILLWAYLHAMQFIVVWMANIPREADWYLRRGEGGWAVVAGLLAAGQFALPFLLLLPVPLRRSLPLLKTLAAATLLLRLLETAWLVLPAASGVGWAPGLLAATASSIGMVCLLALAPPALPSPTREA